MTDTVTTMAAAAAAAVVSTTLPPGGTSEDVDGNGLKSGGVVEGGIVLQSNTYSGILM